MNRKEFFEWLAIRYKFDSDESNEIKYREIIKKAEGREYNWQGIADEMAEQKFFGFPEWADVKQHFYNYVCTISEPEEPADPDGEWVCRHCLGKRGHMITKMTDMGEYDFFVICPTCLGVGKKFGYNVFKKYKRHKPGEKDWLLEKLGELCKAKRMR